MRNILYICFLSFFLFGWGVQGQAKKKNKEKKETLTGLPEIIQGQAGENGSWADDGS